LLVCMVWFPHIRRFCYFLNKTVWKYIEMPFIDLVG